MWYDWTIITYTCTLQRSVVQNQKKNQHIHIMKKRGKKPEQAIKSDETHFSILHFIFVEYENDVFFSLLFFK